MSQSKLAKGFVSCVIIKEEKHLFVYILIKQNHSGKQPANSSIVRYLMSHFFLTNQHLISAFLILSSPFVLGTLCLDMQLVDKWSVFV